MTDFGTVIVRFRSPALSTTSAVMTFTMLPIGRSVLRSRLHKTLPVAALARAAPLTLIPEGPGMEAAVAVATMPRGAAPRAPGVMTVALTGTAAATTSARAARAIRSGRITRESGGVGTKIYSSPRPTPTAPARQVRTKCQLHRQGWPRRGASHRDGAVRNEVGHVVVQLGHGLVEGGEPRSVRSRELGQVGVRYLAMADDPRNGNIGVRDVIGPEFVPRVGGGLVKDRSRRGRLLALADEQAHQAALGDRAGREVFVQADEPVLGGGMVNVI